MATRSTKQARLDEARSALAAADDARRAGEHRRGAELAAQALAAARDAGPLRLQASALNLLALHEWRIGHAESAIGHGLQALPLFKRNRDAAGRSQVLCTLAMAYNDVGLHGDALAHVTKAIEAARTAADPSLMSWALNRTGVTYEMMGDCDRAERFKLQALEIARRVGGSEEMFSALNNLCSLLHAASDKAATPQAAQELLLRGLAHGQEALALASASGNTHRIAISHGNLGMVLLRLGRYDESLTHMDQAGELAQRHGYRGLSLSLIADRAMLHDRRGELDAAIAMYEQALAQAHGTDDHTMLAGLHEALHKIYKTRGDLAQALAHHEALLPLEREQMKQRADTQARLLLNRLELEQAQAEADRARLDAEVQRLRASHLETENRQLAVKAMELGRHALEDQLTGLANRRRVDHELPGQLAAARERRGALSVAAVDLDHFKQVNDRYGHAVGDDVLRAVARILLDNTRSSDLLARMGGEEFLVLFVGTSITAATDICERLRTAVEDFDWSRIAPGLGLTISIGLCDAVTSSDMRALLERADASLYAAKRAGRNRVEVALTSS
ncbi:MAG TPA: tetratricopeptide repeat-containing diguanylate cyclase [Albitalea sp.]|uniref:tetratricopeptide repeat-containing diguanylate cyclase n=1 Tax=Piscinibacter sp. TaxID=1903157 RepID=UPI002ED00859